MNLKKKLACLFSAFLMTISLGSVANSRQNPVKADETNTQEFSLTSLILEYQNSNWFIWFVSDQTDWPGNDKMTDSYYYNVLIDDAYQNRINVANKVLFNDTSIMNGGYYNGTQSICMWCRGNRFSMSVRALPENLTSIVIPKGTIFPSFQTAKGGEELNYVIKEEERYSLKKSSDTAYTIRKEVQVTSEEDTVTSVNVVTGYSGASKFACFALKKNDYEFDYNHGNDYPVHTAPVDYHAYTNFWSDMTLNGAALNLNSRATYLNYFANYGAIGVDITEEAASLKDGDILFIPKGTTFPSYSSLSGGEMIVYTISSDCTFTYSNGAFRKYVETTSSKTSVTSLSIITGYNGSDKFLILNLSENDYDNEILHSDAYNKGNDFNVATGENSFRDCSNFATSISINGVATNFEKERIFINYFANYGSIGICFNTYAGSIENSDKVTIPAGTTFPSFLLLINQGTTVFETEEDVTFTYYENSFHVCAAGEDAGYEKDETGHWLTCAVCGEELEHEEHIPEHNHKDPTCTEPGFEECTFCTLCGYVMVEGEEIPALGHDFDDSEYEYDEEYHWKHCSRGCGEQNEKVAHNYGADGKTCTECGYQRNVVFLTVVNGYINGHDDNVFVPGTRVTISANAPEAGMKFDAWYIGEESVSTNSTYSFVIEVDTTIEARYVEDEDPIEPIDDENNKTKGCGGSIVASSSLLTLASISLLVLLGIKKKQD